MAKLKYNHPQDNVVSLATLLLDAGTEDPLYPLANLRDLNPTNPFRWTTQTGAVVFDFGSPQTVHLPILINPRLDAGLDVRWQGNATNSWGSPTFSQAFTIGAKDNEGYTPNAHLDLSVANPSFRYYRLAVIGTNSVPVAIGEVWIGATIRTLVHNYLWGFHRGYSRPGSRRWETRYGVRWNHPSRGKRRTLTGGIETSNAGLAAVDAWNVACGGQDRPTVIVPDLPNEGDAMLAFWNVEWEYEGKFTDDNQIPVGWLEVARGMPL